MKRMARSTHDTGYCPVCDAPDDEPYCVDCGHTFDEDEPQYEDELGNLLCGTCRERYPCRYCQGPIPAGIRDEYCSDECALMDGVNADKDLEADHKIRADKGD